MIELFFYFLLNFVVKAEWFVAIFMTYNPLFKNDTEILFFPDVSFKTNFPVVS